MQLNKQTPLNYDDFLLQNRKYINASILRIILVCIFTGPAIALGIHFGVFKLTSYIACINISMGMLIIFFICSYLYKFFPYSTYSSLLGIASMNLLLVYMSIEHIELSITWYLMPMLSMLLLDSKIYFVSLLFNYSMIVCSIYLSGYDITTFYSKFFGRTIESIIMGIVGFEIGRLITFYYKSLIDEKVTTSTAQAQMHKQFTLLESMADLYDNVNYIDFGNMTEESLQGEHRATYTLDLEENNHSHMVRSLTSQVAPESLKRFLKFTDLLTVQKRLENRKIIYLEFLNKNREWFRAQYINVDPSEQDIPQKIIFTIQNIDEEKKKEDHLLQIALTDELTLLYNRRCYKDDVAELNKHPLPKNLVLLSVDVNGLKLANDTLGHYAGDELISGASKCLLTAVGNHGKVYRTGGDEFMAILFTYNFSAIEQALISNVLNWHGEYIRELTLSYGYATYADFPDTSLKELEKIADKNMYINKEHYYMEKGIDRQSLYKTLQN